MPAAPRKLIWVAGEASGVPGSGETVTGFTAAALTADWVSMAAEPTNDAPPHAQTATALASSVQVRTGRPTALTLLGPAPGAPVPGERDRHRALRDRPLALALQ